MVPPHARGLVRCTDRARAGRAARTALAAAAGSQLSLLRNDGLVARADPLSRQNRRSTGIPDVAGDPGNRGSHHEAATTGAAIVLGAGPVARESDCCWGDPQPLAALAYRCPGARPVPCFGFGADSIPRVPRPRRIARSATGSHPLFPQSGRIDLPPAAG